MRKGNLVTSGTSVNLYRIHRVTTIVNRKAEQAENIFTGTFTAFDLSQYRIANLEDFLKAVIYENHFIGNSEEKLKTTIEKTKSELDKTITWKTYADLHTTEFLDNFQRRIEEIAKRLHLTI